MRLIVESNAQPPQIYAMIGSFKPFAAKDGQTTLRLDNSLKYSWHWSCMRIPHLLLRAKMTRSRVVELGAGMLKKPSHASFVFAPLVPLHLFIQCARVVARAISKTKCFEVMLKPWCLLWFVQISNHFSPNRLSLPGSLLDSISNKFPSSHRRQVRSLICPSFVLRLRRIPPNKSRK